MPAILLSHHPICSGTEYENCGGVRSGRQNQDVMLCDSDATWCMNTVVQCKSDVNSKQARNGLLILLPVQNVVIHHEEDEEEVLAGDDAVDPLWKTVASFLSFFLLFVVLFFLLYFYVLYSHCLLFVHLIYFLILMIIRKQ